MAFNEKEKEIINWGLQNGKSQQEVQTALQKYRGVAMEQPKPQESPQTQKETVGSQISGAFNSGIDQIKQGYNQGYNAKNPLELIEGGLKQGAGIVNTIFSPLAPLTAPIGKGVEYVADKVSDNPNVQKFAMSKAGETTQRVVEDINNANTIAGAVAGPKGTARTASVVRNAVVDTIDSATENISKVKSKVPESFTSPDVSQATKVSLNPVKAMAGKTEDITVSVGGKTKKLSELTVIDKTKIKQSTNKSIETFQKEAQKFKDTRNPLNDPTEIVGQRVDKALGFADKKRQVIGQKMGDIEIKYADENIPISDKTLNSFSETVKHFENPKYGVDSVGSNVVKKLVTDFDMLEKSGATVAERLDFVRRWDSYLNDAKDAFGNFKENATVNTRIQNAVRELKNETVDFVANKDKVYRDLRVKYRVFKQLDEIGNSLLGKDGLLGDRVKGGATVKRALKSNSDAGARQFLIKLKELTGYDAIKDGDLALTAMELVGDFQGLSLLEVLKQGKSGLYNKVLEKVQDATVGNKEKRVNKYIND